MKSLVLAAALVVVLSGVARAEDTGRSLTGLPTALLGGAAAEGTQHILPHPPVSSITVAGLSIVLGETPLTDVAAKLGGTISNASDGGQSASWLCYAETVNGKLTYVWFVANGASADGKINLVGANFRLDLTTELPCPEPKVSVTDANLSAPGLGASEAALQERFGVVAARNGMVAYSSLHGSAMQNLNYMIADGAVVGVAVTEIASP